MIPTLTIEAAAKAQVRELELSIPQTKWVVLNHSGLFHVRLCT